MKKSTNIILPVAAVLAFGQLGSVYAQDTTPALAADTLAGKVNVAFRTADFEEVLGGVSSINVAELDKKSFMTYSLENMSSLVTGYDGQLWGMGDCLVLVDGVPRDADNILPQEIETITFLKGAQAVVLYGSTAAKGAILITTKRGRTTGLQVNVRGDFGLYVPKSYPKYVGAAEYMTLYNEARANDGLNAAFSAEDIYHYASGQNPWRYPDINFYSDDYLKKNWQRYEGQAQFMGGGEFAKFYAMLDLYHTTSIINFGEGKHNGTTRLGVRGNIDLNLNKYVKGWVNTSATFYDNRYDRSNFWNAAATMRQVTPGSANLMPLIPISAIEENDENSWVLVNNSKHLIDGKYILGGTQQTQTNAIADMYAAGYTKQTIRQLQFDAGFSIDLNSLLRGLSFTARGAVDYHTSYYTSIENSYAIYEATWTNYGGKDVIGTLTKYGDDLSTGTQNLSGSAERQTLMFSGQFDYKNRFNDVHNVEAMLVAHGYKRSVTGVYQHNTNVSLALRAAYNYANRYYAEFNGALNHSTKFAPGHRNGFSPVGSIGWRLSQEEWLKDSPVVDELRINATYGMLQQDLDITDGYYLWETTFTADADYWGWNDGHGSNQSFQSRQGGNTDLTFVKRKEVNVGIEGSLWQGSLQFNGNFFNANIDGLPVKATTVFPSYMALYWPSSSFIPWINYNNRRVTGFDLGVRGGHDFGQVRLELGANVMYTTTKNTRVAENVEYDWLRTEGAVNDALRGYHCLGFFQSEEEIQSSAVINSNTKPGDLKYEDMNKDGIIDSRDMIQLGRWGSPWTYGLNLTAKYKGFTLFVTASAVTGGTGVMNNSWAWVYGENARYSEIVRGRWTPETASTATYPRLTTQGGELNFVTSDFWTYKTDAFSLDQVQLTYDFPSQWFANKFVKGLQVYVNGNSLVWACKNRKYRETSVGSTPQTRSYNLGVQVNF